MKLTEKEREALSMLRALDGQQRDELLAQIRRASLANNIVSKVARKAGALKRIRTAPDYRIVKAFGTLPRGTKAPGSRG